MTAPVTLPRLPDGIPSTYVVHERDEAIVAAQQRQQIDVLGPDHIVTIDAGHSAFATHPAELAALLLQWA